MKKIRQLHSYVGTFFAPAILFFAFSGVLQTFGLHESEEGESYQPPAWVVTLADLHKDQQLGKAHKAHAAQSASPDATHDDDHDHGAKPGHDAPAAQSDERSTLPLKLFVLALALGLMGSAALGVYMAFQNRNNRRTTWIVLIAGLAVPIVLMFL